MKRILIASDLSPASDKAVEYGLNLAAAVGATVTMVAAYEDIPIPVADTMTMTIVDAPGIMELTEKGLRRQVGLYQHDKMQPIQTLAVKGAVIHSILDTAAGVGAELIVVGMKAKGKTLRRVFGSTVTALARETPVPLLVIPEEAGYTPPSTILLGNDIRPDTNIHALDPLRELAAVFASKTYALRMVRKGAKEFIEVIHRQGPLQDLDRTWEVKYEYEMGENVVAGLNDFVRRHRVDLVVMIPHSHALPERWFMRSHTRKMIFEVPVPLLVLPE